MFVEKENYYFIEEFEKLGIKAVYTKKNAGNMSDYCPLENQVQGIQKENRKKLLEKLNLEGKQEVMAFQTHSANVFVIDENIDKYYYEKECDIDGFLTKRKDIAIFTFYADCLPIFVYDKKNEFIGVWHSGWPGTFKGMMKSGLEKMKEVLQKIIIESLEKQNKLPDFSSSVKMILYRQSQRLIDEDSIAASFKYIIDGLRDKQTIGNIDYNILKDDNQLFVSSIMPIQVKNKRNIIAIKIIIDKNPKNISSLEEFIVSE